MFDPNHLSMCPPCVWLQHSLRYCGLCGALPALCECERRTPCQPVVVITGLAGSVLSSCFLLLHAFSRPLVIVRRSCCMISYCMLTLGSVAATAIVAHTEGAGRAWNATFSGDLLRSFASSRACSARCISVSSKDLLAQMWLGGRRCIHHVGLQLVLEAQDVQKCALWIVGCMNSHT